MWNPNLNFLGTITSPVMLQTGHVQLSCKILIAFNFVCLEPCEVKVLDIQAIFLDLNFTGRTSDWGSANFKNKARQINK